jgi:hypothetical protein
VVIPRSTGQELCAYKSEVFRHGQKFRLDMQMILGGHLCASPLRCSILMASLFGSKLGYQVAAPFVMMGLTRMLQVRLGVSLLPQSWPEMAFMIWTQGEDLTLMSLICGPLV